MNKLSLLVKILLFSTHAIAISSSENLLIYDVAIIGSGPAGLTAGTYTARAQLKTIIIEGDLPGGQLMKAGKVENWPGEISILGPDLIAKMSESAERYGCTFLSETITDADFTHNPFTLTTNGNNKRRHHCF